MAVLNSLALRIALPASFLLTAVAASPLAQERVGISSAVNPQASGTPPGRATRQLVIGQDVVFNERITTSEAGQTQVLFLDESSMTIGPNSDVTIDQFVYDPNSGTGTLAMSATRGLLRYVGGKLSKQDGAVTLRTSTATLAVRGGAFIASHEPAGETTAIFIYGNGLTVTGLNATSQTMRRPGFQVTVSGPGAPPSAPRLVPPAQLAQIVQQLDGRAGRTGGATVVPTNAAVAQSGISQTVSGDVGASIQQAVQNQTGTAVAVLATASTNPVDAQGMSNQVNTAAGQIIDCTAAGTCSGQQVGSVTPPPAPLPPAPLPPAPQPPEPPIAQPEPPPAPLPPAPPTPTPVTVTYAGRVKNTNGQGTARGFADQSADGDFAYAAGTLSFPQGAPQSGVFTGTFGNLGTISFPLVPGSASFGPQGTSSGFGTFSGTSFLSDDNTFFYANITPTSQPTERLFLYGGLPVNPSFYQATGSTRIFSFTVQPDAALQSNIPFIRSQAGGNLPNASVSPLYIVAPPNTAIGDATTGSAARGLQASLAIDGQGANQQSTIAVTTGTIAGLDSTGQPVFSGHMRGSSAQVANTPPVRLGSAVSSPVDGNGNTFYGDASVTGFVLDQSGFAGVPGSGIVSAPSTPGTAQEVALAGTAQSYGFAQPAVSSSVPSGVGDNRSTQTISGSFGGLMHTGAQTNPYVVTGDTQISTDAATNRVEAVLSGSAQAPSVGVNTLTMQYGGLTGNAGGRQAFIDDKTFAVLESQTNPQQINGANLVVNGDAAPAGRLYLATSGAAGEPTSLLPSGASYCQCQYLQWGYWGGDLRTGNSVDSTISRVDRGHINTWVAGVPTPQVDLNSLIGQSATATYTGHAIGSVFNSGASYVAAGGFTGHYSFGTQTGTMSVTNFDGKSFSASGAAPLSGANYAISTTSPVGTAAINGAFYGPNAAETGGNFAFQSATGLPAYLASGIFAGKR